VTTQLRLVESPTEDLAESPAADRRTRRPTGVPADPGRGPGRRSPRATELRLDARTRRIGRAGVAAARAALEHARIDTLPTAEQLPRAS
jgi:hypothetical protein